MLWKLFCYSEMKAEQPQAWFLMEVSFLTLVSLTVPALSHLSCPPVTCESIDQFYPNWANSKKAQR